MRTQKSVTAVCLWALFSGISLSIFSCSKDDATPVTPIPVYNCVACHDTPDALAENDASVKGMYKGVFVGSTGTISINILNGSNTITATMVLDNESIALVSNVSVVEGQSYVAPFTGIYQGSPVSITFSVGLSGSSPTMVSSDIPGHPNAVFELYKETSDSLVEAFEGTITKNGTPGTFNIVVARSLSVWGYIVKSADPTDPADIGSGTMNGNQLIEDDLLIGTITGDVVLGAFTDTNNDSFVVNGHRTL